MRSDEGQTNRRYPKTAIRFLTVRATTVTSAAETPQDHTNSREPTETSHGGLVRRDEDQTNRIYPQTATRVLTVEATTVTSPINTPQEHAHSREPAMTSQRRSRRRELHSRGCVQCQQLIRGASSRRHRASPWARRSASSVRVSRHRGISRSAHIHRCGDHTYAK